MNLGDHSKPKQYQQRCVMVTAIRWAGDNFRPIHELVGSDLIKVVSGEKLLIRTSQGIEAIHLGDYVIQSADKRLSKCNSLDFESLYDEEKVG